MANQVYYCPSCNHAEIIDSFADERICPKCGKTIYATGVDEDTWNKKTEPEQQEAKEKWKVNLSKGGFTASGVMAKEEFSIGGILRIIGIAFIIICIIGATTIAKEYDDKALGWAIGLVGVTEALVICGLGEICQSLMRISKKVDKIEHNTN